MSEISIRNASRDEATTIVPMIRLMVTDMADHGGHMPATEDSAWEKLTSGIAEDLNDPSVRYVLAQSTSGGIAGGRRGQAGHLGRRVCTKEDPPYQRHVRSTPVQAPAHRRRADDKNAR